LEWKKSRIRKLVTKTCREKHARILDPSIDIYFPDVATEPIAPAEDEE